MASQLPIYTLPQKLECTECGSPAHYGVPGYPCTECTKHKKLTSVFLSHNRCICGDYGTWYSIEGDGCRRCDNHYQLSDIRISSKCRICMISECTNGYVCKVCKEFVIDGDDVRKRFINRMNRHITDLFSTINVKTNARFPHSIALESSSFPMVLVITAYLNTQPATGHDEYMKVFGKDIKIIDINVTEKINNFNSTDIENCIGNIISIALRHSGRSFNFH